MTVLLVTELLLGSPISEAPASEPDSSLCVFTHEMNQSVDHREASSSASPNWSWERAERCRVQLGDPGQHQLRNKKGTVVLSRSFRQSCRDSIQQLSTDIEVEKGIQLPNTGGTGDIDFGEVIPDYIESHEQ
uniref:Uncharacterized protein n=1 Tax=Candidatus Kentrum sp. FW TaxID=2126338 RepID=A0A450TCN8_9GAMM|nr:MAG: hypothetical protein BECKFW1821C_GA0114237_100619 [Candidatus Kentron sp. FW]